LKKYEIAVIKGDGIGPEIIDEAIKVLDAVSKKYNFSLSFTNVLMGGCAIDSEGVPLSQESINKCKASHAVLLGAVGGQKWDKLPGHLRPEAGLLLLRSSLNLYANLRPAKVFKSLVNASPLKSELVKNLDILVVRELTGGMYFGERGRDELSAYDTERYTVSEITRIAHTAFKAAMGRDKRLCSVDKANVLESSRLWRSVVNDISNQYPDILLSHMYVDNCAMQLVRNPSQFDVILTSNMFGDILSDEASQICGSIGLLPSASIGDGSFGLYEPIHGSAPDIAGQNIANPLGAILSAAMMLRYSLNENEAANDIEKAVEQVLKTCRTADIFEPGTKKLTCVQMGSSIMLHPDSRCNLI